MFCETTPMATDTSFVCRYPIYQGWQMVNLRLYEIAIRSFSCASLRPFQFLNCKTELQSILNASPKLFKTYKF